MCIYPKYLESLFFEKNKYYTINIAIIINKI
jgi:hypothetical protein